MGVCASADAGFTRDIRNSCFFSGLSIPLVANSCLASSAGMQNLPSKGHVAADADSIVAQTLLRAAETINKKIIGSNNEAVLHIDQRRF